jgi:hypothetical protein
MAELRDQQFALARHVRDPARNAPPPGIEDRRLAIYRDLFYNSIESLLAGNFPVIRKTLGDSRWHALVRAFYADHRCRTPLFTEIGREFIQYLEFLEHGRLEHRRLEHRAQGDNPPWLHELAHYEWVELALQIADDEPPPHDPGGDLLTGKPVPSPLAWALAYAWPVSRIGPEFQPERAPDTPSLLLVRRDAAGDVHFSELSPLVYRLLQLLDDESTASGHAALQVLAAEAGADDLDAFLGDGLAMLHRLRAEGVLLGTRPA